MATNSVILMSVLLFIGAFTWVYCTDRTVGDPATTADDLDEKSLCDSLTAVFNKDYLMGRFNPETHPDFSRIDRKYSDRDDRYMRTDAYEAFKKMYQAAIEDGVRLQIVSAARNFDKQKTIWEAKWDGRTIVEGGQNLALTVPDPVERARIILRFSSMPGTSRHHWGTDIDLNQLENEWFEHGEGRKLYNWMIKNAASFGYCQPYTAKHAYRLHGYEEEKWHWTYMPVSEKLTAIAEHCLLDDDIKGFKGDQVTSLIGVVHHYVLGIEPECRFGPGKDK